MTLHYLPTVIFLILCVGFLFINGRKQILLVYFGTVVCYLNVFPLIDQFLLRDVDSFLFSKYQLIIILCFEVPLVVSAILFSNGNRKSRCVGSDKINFPVLFYIFLLLLASVFWFVSIQYDLFFRRQGHEALARVSLSVPIVLLYIYRATVEISFLIINILFNQYMHQKAVRQRSLMLNFVLTVYVFTFVSFYISNSRMHLVLLILTVLCFQPRLRFVIRNKISFVWFVVLISSLVISVTILREVVFEQNDRLKSGSVSDMIISALELVTLRMDPLLKLYELDKFMPDIFRLDLEGYFSVFGQNPVSAKESLFTSISVLIANSMTWTSDVDFMKTMFLDSYLSFGVVGVVIISLFLGGIVGWSQSQLDGPDIFGGRSLLAMYLFTVALQFEKEFAGFLVSLVKWFPLFSVCYLLISMKKVRLNFVLGTRKSK